MYEKYEHWQGRPEVWVKSETKGQHRDHCLCWSCDKFIPNPEGNAKNCHIANVIYSLCVAFNMTLPVWECPIFVER